MAACKRHAEPRPSASAPWLRFYHSGKMDTKRAKTPQAAAGTMPAFLTEAFTNQYPSREEAAASDLLLHRRVLPYTGRCPRAVPAQVRNRCCTNAVSKLTMERSIPSSRSRLSRRLLRSVSLAFQEHKDAMKKRRCLCQVGTRWAAVPHAWAPTL